MVKKSRKMVIEVKPNGDAEGKTKCEAEAMQS